MFVQQYIDSLDFARNGLEIRGKIPASEMPRLQAMLAAPEGEFSYHVRGVCSSLGRPMLQVTLDGSCQLICQRCLQSLAYPVKLLTHLILVPADQLDLAEDDGEDCDSIPADTRTDVLALLEEELLLSLPFAPTHPPESCSLAMGSLAMVSEEIKEAGQAATNPFAVLAKLKSG